MLAAIDKSTRSVIAEVRSIRGNVDVPAALCSILTNCGEAVSSTGRIEALALETAQAVRKSEGSTRAMLEKFSDISARLKRIDGTVGVLRTLESSAACTGAAVNSMSITLADRTSDIQAQLKRREAEQRQVRQAVEELGRHFAILFGPKTDDTALSAGSGLALEAPKPVRRGRPASAAAVPRSMGR
jgi:hypothetical protein